MILELFDKDKAQSLPERYGCKVDKETGQDVFRLQGSCEG